MQFKLLLFFFSSHWEERLLLHMPIRYCYFGWTKTIRKCLENYQVTCQAEQQQQEEQEQEQEGQDVTTIYYYDQESKVMRKLIKM